MGKSTTVRSVGYIGPRDLGHILLTYACIKVGCAHLHLSPMNSVEGAIAVLEAPSCELWAKASDVPAVPLVNSILQKGSMRLLEIALLEELLGDASTVPGPNNVIPNMSDCFFVGNFVPDL